MHVMSRRRRRNERAVNLRAPCPGASKMSPRIVLEAMVRAQFWHVRSGGDKRRGQAHAVAGRMVIEVASSPADYANSGNRSGW